MTDYISREAAKGCVKEHYDDAIIIALDKLPAADVRPVVRGKWIDDYPLSTCSACGKQMILCDVANFCPNCGARMEES